jgi:hypothetical protein
MKVVDYASMDYIPTDSRFVPVHTLLGRKNRNGQTQLLSEPLGLKPPKALAPTT